MIPLVFRDATEDDRAFIFDSWAESFRNSPFGQTLPLSMYRPLQDAKMREVTANATIIMAALQEDPEIALGYVISSKRPDALTVIHYLYVKTDHRRNGIGRALLNQLHPGVPAIFTDITRDFYRLRIKHNLPYLTARELEEFETHHSNPMRAFADWYHNRAHLKTNPKKRRL